MLVILPVGETHADVDKIYLGRNESAFTERGWASVVDAAETLMHYRFDHAFSSDLYRAQDTLQEVIRVNRHTPPWEYVEELRERSGGSYEGLRYADIRKGMSPKQYRSWDRDPFDAPSLGESLVDVADRVRPWFGAEVRSRLRDHQSVLLVSHPDTVKVLIALARCDDLHEAIGVKIEPGMPYFYHG